MAKLYFRFGAMNSGKTTALLQTAYNYEERGHRVLIAKPQVDTKAEQRVLSRLGVSRPVDALIATDCDLLALVAEHRGRVRAESGMDISCILVDEVQFLSATQIDDLLRIAVLENIPVIAYGLRTDFVTAGFSGSRRLLEVAHSLEELKTMCRCGKKAILNSRRVGDRFVFDGEQVAIDGENVGYESLCGACYLTESGGKLEPRN